MLNIYTIDRLRPPKGKYANGENASGKNPRHSGNIEVDGPAKYFEKELFIKVGGKQRSTNS